MKSTIYLFCVVLLCATSCNSNGQNDAAQTLQSIQSQKAANTPGMVPTSSAGYKMTAKVNGNQWEAREMYPPKRAGRIVGSLGKETIGLPYSSSGYHEGEIIKFHVGNAVDLFTNDEVGIWGGTSGQMQITKVDGKWVEGTFYFTATTSQDASKSLPVTDGFFRIPVDE